ncbi:MAG TPA: hypothetical protein VFV73_28190 [Streptosporangiaceae bacterium]|nr:hypothetical protein [Streptosporangiaceae bacterium]
MTTGPETGPLAFLASAQAANDQVRRQGVVTMASWRFARAALGRRYRRYRRYRRRRPRWRGALAAAVALAAAGCGSMSPSPVPVA